MVRLSRLVTITAVVASATACGAGDDNQAQCLDCFDAGPDAEPPGPDAQPSCPDVEAVWAGAYDLSGTYELSAPLNADRGLGDLVADLLVEDAVDLLGVPAFLADDAKALLEDQIGQTIRTRINNSASDQWLRNDSFIADLIAVTADVQFFSQLTLETSELGVAGLEELEYFRVEYQGISHDIDANTVAGGFQYVPVLADWIGTAEGPVLNIEDHEFGVRYGEFVSTIVSEVIGTSALDAFEGRVTAAVDCQGIVDAITSNGELGISVSGYSYSISADPLRSACDAIVASAVGGVVGIFDIDSGIVVGGEVLAVDETCDGVADALETANGTFSGHFDVVGPVALAPSIGVEFRGTRGTRVAYADMRNALGSLDSFPVRGRIVWEHGVVDKSSATPYREVLQDEIRSASLTLTLEANDQSYELGAVQADGEGYIDTSISIAGLGVAAGQHLVEVHYQDNKVGSFDARLLPESFAAPVVRSDIDKTYLESNFQSVLGLMNLLSSDARERNSLPAMATVYQQLTSTSPLTFLSGSPRFFSRIMESKMMLDAFHQDGMTLKPFKDIIMSNLLDFSPSQIEPELEEQIGYKLHALLRWRLEVPGDTSEILLGDDSEADHLIYSLYANLLSGALSEAAIEAELLSLGVASEWQSKIAPLLGLVTAHNTTGRVLAIYIRQTGSPSSAYLVDDYRIALTRYHDGTWPIALDLYQQGWFDQAQVNAVRASLSDIGVDEADLIAAAQAGLADGFLEQLTINAFHP